LNVGGIKKRRIGQDAAIATGEKDKALNEEQLML